MDKHLSQTSVKIHASGLHTGKPKPRLRLLTVLPSSRTSSILPDYTTVRKMDEKNNPSEQLPVMGNPSLDSEPELQQYPERSQKLSRLSRFVKRFSMTFNSNNELNAQESPKENLDVPQSDDKQTSVNRFDFSHWRRRKSSSRPKYSQPERDRSPLGPVNSPGLDLDAMNHTICGTEKQILFDSSNGPSIVETTPTPVNSPLFKLVSKRRTSLSRWFPHSIKHSRHSIKLLSPPKRVSSPGTVMLSTSKRLSEQLSQPEDCNLTIVEGINMTKKKIRKSYFASNNHLSNSTVSDVSKFVPHISVSHNSAETVLDNESNCKKSALNDAPAKFAERSFNNGSTLSCSFSDSQDSFDYKPNLSQTESNERKSWFSNPINAVDTSIYQRCCSSSGTSMFSDWETESMDPVLARSAYQNSSPQIVPPNLSFGLDREKTLQRKELLSGSSDLSYVPNDLLDYPGNSCQSLSKASKKLADICTNQFGTVNAKLLWTGRLKNSVNRANRKRILMAGTTLFNRNPSEGINYLVKHGIIVYHPISIARFLYSDRHLNRQAIGEYFGQISDVMAAKVLREFLSFIDMKDMEVDEALRSVLSHFHPSGESQKIAFLMQQFQEIYVNQNSDRVSNQFQNSATIEVLAYSVLLLHTDLHNPNVRRLGKRMTESDFIMNNRGIDSDHDIQTPILEGIYRRISETQFKTLPDPSDRMRILDTILTGHLKTENFVQRHRRFVGWTFVQQLEKIAPKRPSTRSHIHWRYLFIFNDILVIAKPTNTARVRPDHVLNKAAHAALTDIGSLRTGRSRHSSERQSSLDSASMHSDSSEQISETSRKVHFSNEPSLDMGPCQVKTVLPLLELRVLVFETQCYRYGVQLCSSNGPVASFNLLSHPARRQLVNWLQESIAEMQELQIHQKQLETERMDKLNQGTLKPSAPSDRSDQQPPSLPPPQQQQQQEEITQSDHMTEIIN